MFKERALQAIAEGMYVFPLNGKLPFKGSRGSKDASNDIALTKQRMGKVPTANIGIATGAANNLFVVDIDVKDGATGMEEWDLLIQNNGPIPNSYEVITPTGGKHLYFKYPPNLIIKNSQSELAPYIDVRGEGGYVVGAGSIINGKKYEAELSNGAIPEAPVWLLDLIQNKKQTKEVERQDYKVPDMIPRGVRNDELHRLAASLFGKGLHPTSIMAVLRNERDTRCDSPETMSDNELQAIVNSVMNLETFADYRSTGTKLDIATDTPLSDTFNAEFLNEKFSKTLTHCKETGADLLWNGKFWSLDSNNTLYVKTTDLFKYAYRQVFEKGDKDLMAHFTRALNATGMRNTLSTFRSLNTRSVTEFDENHYYFNMNNGVYDLSAHRLLPHTKHFYLTKFAAYDYNPNSKCPNWEAFIDKIFMGDTELINYVQEAIGYSLTGDVGHHAFFICHGGGANGKSTFFDAIRRMIGAYSEKIPATSLMEKKYDEVPHDIAQLNKVRLVLASESSRNKQLNEARIKELTGDSDIQVRHLFKEYFTMKITFKVWLQTNHKPTIKGTDHGIWRRIKMIPFNYRFTEEEKITDFAERYLFSELSGIFNWAVEGLKRIQNSSRWKEPKAVLDATAQYREEEDVIGEWLETDCILNENAQVKFVDLFSFFQETSGYKFGKKTFKEYIRNKGYEIVKGTGNHLYVKGIGIDYPESERPY